MQSFQKKGREYRSMETKKCIHGRCSMKYMSNSQVQRVKPILTQDCKNQYSHSMTKSNVDDPHTSMMKSLIAMNEDYFQNKLQVPNDGKPSKLKLKIPSTTGATIYKRDYIKNFQSLINSHGIIPNFKEKKVKPDFFGNTTYRNQFLGVQNEGNNQKRKENIFVASTAPINLESQYKHNYQNWGSQSHMPSMKPYPNPAVTNLPFQPSTTYSLQYTKKSHKKIQNFKPSNSTGQANQLGNSSIISSQVSSPLFYATTNNAYFDKKKNSKENNLKPKTQTLCVGGNFFKGKTQYQSQFIKSKGIGVFQHGQKKPLQDLQNLILNL